jgi:hypothetical protein
MTQTHTQKIRRGHEFRVGTKKQERKRGRGQTKTRGMKIRNDAVRHSAERSMQEKDKEETDRNKKGTGQDNKRRSDGEELNKNRK